jgi:dTDP-4-amino-4,6-dideoxy-D-galactose acyltransferase
MKTTESKLVAFLPWDTEFFGIRTARLSAQRVSPEELEAALVWCREQAIRCLYFQADPDDPATIRLAETQGFQLVDIRVDFEKEGRPADLGTPDSAIREASPADLPALQQLFAGISGLSRFHADARFPPDAAARLYKRWIERSFEGFADFVLVAEEHGTLLGGITGQLDAEKKSARIGLFAVDGTVRSKGIGRRLMQAFFLRAAGQGYTLFRVATQGRNIAAQRFYARSGFLVKSLQLTYHKWMDD